MKIILILFLSLFSLNVSAYDHFYDVSGTDGGEVIKGTIYSNNGDAYLTGELTDENGNEHSFQGRWNGSGEMSGVIDEGDSIDLNLN